MYNQIAKGYNELHKEEQLEKLNIIKNNIIIKKEYRLLDVGCGTGISTEFFDCNCTGIDSSKEMIKQGKGNLIVAKAENLPFPDNSFEIVISITAIHNFDDYKKGLSEMSRVLKHNGIIVITLLKKANNYPEIKSYLIRELQPEIIDSEKDTIFIAKNVK